MKVFLLINDFFDHFFHQFLFIYLFVFVIPFIEHALVQAALMIIIYTCSVLTV